MDQPEFGRIAEIAPGNRRADVAEGIGTVGFCFILKTKALLLLRQVIRSERFAAHVERTRCGTVRVGDRVALGDHLAIFANRTKRLIPHFVIDNHILAKVGDRRIGDHCLPAALERAAGVRVEIGRSGLLDNKNADHAEPGLLPVAVAVKRQRAFLMVGRNVPLIDLALAILHDRVGIGRRRRLTRLLNDRAGAVNMNADRLFIFFIFVAQGNNHAIALIGPDDQRLNHVTLQAVGRSAGIIFFFPRRGIGGFFFAHRVDIFGEHIDIAGVEVEPLIQRHLDVRCRDVEFLHGSRFGAAATGADTFFRVARPQQHALLHHSAEHVELMARPLHGGEGPFLLCAVHVMGYLLVRHLLNQVDSRQPGRTPFERILDDHLCSQFLLPVCRCFLLLRLYWCRDRRGLFGNGPVRGREDNESG